ncbi:BRCA1-associated protein isoform X1 [Harmonia axyridis]|uniref:BRCA1-associated protein isoform X1 n=1 Tax=Harmonia axyridis TaxID=115357 RepID=UPI001E278621|nr:BRCA1-associated protein isoform X1 [Harmonia axyridis]
MSDLVSKCVLRVEVKDDKNEEENDSGPTGTNKKGKSTRKRRNVRDISVETFPSVLESPREDWGLLPVSSRERLTSTTKDFENKNEIGFFSGNPFVEITKGVLHLYKEDTLTSKKQALILCILGIPASVTCHDLLTFTAPCHENISHIRVIRDSKPNQYMALLNFRTNDAAVEFYSNFNNLPFNNMEPDSICRIVWVSNVEYATNSTPPPGHTELPICPVCLDRMDESVDGVLTILCNHTFHSNCLEKWSDFTCPVCRFVQSPEQAENSECEECGKTGPSPDALWICLICGHVGCGRYQGGHAAMHYRESGHCFALQLGSHRVWDYKGDNFVHRLLQNKDDGKLVPAGGPPSEAEGTDEKVDSVQLEFTYLLTSQLDEQRMYYEMKLAQLESQLMDENKELRDEVGSLLEENKDLHQKLGMVTKEKNSLEKKVSQQSTKLSTTLRELNEEKQLGKALRNNQLKWQEKFEKLELEFHELQKESDGIKVELKEQIRDLMFYINAKDTIEKSELKDEIASGTVTVAEKSKANKGKKKR